MITLERAEMGEQMERLLKALDEGEEVVIRDARGTIVRLVTEPLSRDIVLPPPLRTLDGRPARLLEALQEDREDRV